MRCIHALILALFFMLIFLNTPCMPWHAVLGKGRTLRRNPYFIRRKETLVYLSMNVLSCLSISQLLDTLPDDGVYAITMKGIVIDTNVFVSALRGKDASNSTSRTLLRAALTGRYTPLFGNALWLEYEDLLGRPVWTDSTTHAERLEVLRALAASGRWVSIYFGWRPNLPDEDDNNLIELAVAGNAKAIVTYNIRDLQRGQLLWPQVRILTPADCLKELP